MQASKQASPRKDSVGAMPSRGLLDFVDQSLEFPKFLSFVYMTMKALKAHYETFEGQFGEMGKYFLKGMKKDPVVSIIIIGQNKCTLN